MDIILREYLAIIRERKTAFFFVMLGLAGGVSLDLLAPVFYKNIANGLAMPFSDETLEMLLDNLLVILGIYAAIWISWRILEVAIIPFEAGGIRMLDKRCFEILLRQRYSFFEDNFSGSLVKSANRFIRSFETIMDWFLFHFVANLLAVTISFIIFYGQQPEFALYFLSWVVLFLSWNVFYSIWKLKFDERVAAWDSKLGGAYSDGISNIFVVKSFALESEERAGVGTLADEAYAKRRLAWALMFVSFAVQGLLTFGIELLLLYLMIDKWKSGSFQVGEFVLFQSILLLLIHRLWDFGRNFRTFFTSLADAREMAEIIRLSEIEKDPETARAIPVTWGRVDFDRIGFGYPGSGVLFDNFSLTIRPGEKVALVGHSGSGKSSLTRLLFRFSEPQQGRVLLDGHDLRDFRLDSLRSQISLVPQQPELFHRSIRDNILLGKQVSEQQLREVARKAGVLEFIDRLPEGFDTPVGERGVKLSGGETQRIAIARALLEEAPVVVLDEATSALDSLTEHEIQKAIFELIEERTAIVIAHRLSTILRMDRIIVMDNGRIIEEGTHQQLLDRKGHYHAMWQHQSGEFFGKA